jgi:putative tryptophan/tyrosine transport system substrate-binding protein
MRRRDFITLLSGAVAWPFTARAQQGKPTLRVGFIVSLTKDNPEAQARLAAFVQALRELGWTNSNIQIEDRYTGGDAERTRRYAAELVALAPDVIIAGNTSTVAPLQQASRSVPIVFAGVVDPVGAGFVDSLAKPGGNTTGFTQFEYGMSGKWLELLKEIAPHVTRAAVLRTRDVTISETGMFAAIQAVAPSLGVEVSPMSIADAEGEIENGIAAFARTSNGGLIVGAGALTVRHRQLIINLAARYRIPAVYPYHFFVIEGGLISYGPDRVDPFRRAAGYVDRILRGEKPSNLPVQAPNKYELTINLRTAKTLGLTVSPSLLTRANEVVE